MVLLLSLIELGLTLDREDLLHDHFLGLVWHLLEVMLLHGSCQSLHIQDNLDGGILHILIVVCDGWDGSLENGFNGEDSHLWLLQILITLIYLGWNSYPERVYHFEE